MGAEIKGKWEWRLGNTLGQNFSQTLTSLHSKNLQRIQDERSYPWAQDGRKNPPLISEAPGRRVFDFFLNLDALGMIHQML